MPKLRPLTDTDRKNAAFVEQIWGKMRSAGISCDEMAQRLGMCKNTLYVRMNRPEKFTLGEIRAIQEIFPEIIIR